MKKTSPFNNKIFLISLGCPRNLVDSEVMIGTLLTNGYQISSSLEEADHIIVNTCGFLETARQESISTIQAALKQAQPNAHVIVTGCMAQIAKETIEATCPGVHFFLGSGDLDALMKAINSEKPGSLISDKKSYLETGSVPRSLSTPKYAYLKIAEGCRKRCSYCIIPEIKGPLKSKPVDQIRQELRELLHQGIEEIILIAQDLGDWGKDLGFSSGSGLCHLLKEILKEPAHFRLRLLYLYPDELTDDVISLIQSNEKIIPYIDMPIQHINDTILKKMYRSTSKKEILSLLSRLREKIPSLVIRTSLIVGFPSETEEQFEELCHFLKEQKLDHVGVFEYSKEEKSAAFSFSDHVPESVKKKRAKKLMEIQKKIVAAKNKKMIGKTIEVVIEGYHPESKYLLIGRHDGQCPEVDGMVIINDARGVDAFGKRYMVTISDAFEYDLVGALQGAHV